MPSGQVAVRVGERHLLVSAALARGLAHLATAEAPLARDATARRLGEVLAPAEALALRNRLWTLVRPPTAGSTLRRDWLHGVVRFPLWRPPPTLVRRFQGRVLTRPVLVAWSALVAAAALSTLVGPWPAVPSLAAVTLRDGLALWLLLSATTVIHEAGHLLVAAHFGVRARAVGVALFYLQPAGFTDVSDAWLAPRRARLAIALGGLWLQAVPLVAGYAAWRATGGRVWLLYCAANVGLLLFNLVPLVRLDGYWVLSHLLEEPNLRSRAYTQLGHLINARRWPAVWPGRKGVVLALFAAASASFATLLYVTGYLALRAVLPGRFHAAVDVVATVVAAATVYVQIARIRAAPATMPVTTAAESAAVESAATTPAATEQPATPGPLWVNPFRWRGRVGDTLLLGAPHAARQRSATPSLDVLLDEDALDERALAAIDPADRRWLEAERFLVPWRADDASAVARQVGFLTFWPGDPHERQARIERATVAVLGMGTLGTQVGYLLAGAGVGRLILCDDDRVELSNLNRQLLYGAADVGRPKVEASAERLVAIRPSIVVTTLERRLDSHDDVRDAARGADVVVRALDTPPEIALVVDAACRSLGVPHVGGGFVDRWAVAGPFVAATGPCLRCLTGAPSVTHARHRRVAVFGPLAFWVASYVAGDVLRHLAGLDEPLLLHRMLLHDGMSGHVTEQKLTPATAGCDVCGRG